MTTGNHSSRKVVILGSGCAGHTAAIYAARSNLAPLVVRGAEYGGQLSLTATVENFPGWTDGVGGMTLTNHMEEQAQRFGAEYWTGVAASVDFGHRPFTLNLDEGRTVRAETLIIATGASARWLGLPSEQALREIGGGVSSCAVCDGFFHTGKEVCVIGGGDSAMEEAVFLTRYATKVTVIHRSDTFRASKILLDRARGHEKIHFLTNTAVEEVLDVTQKRVTGVKIHNVKTGERTIYPTNAVFLGIGHEPNTKVFAGHLDMDREGYLLVRDKVFTRVPGVFAAGDVQDRRYRQAITAAASGCMAALEAERFLEQEGH